MLSQSGHVFDERGALGVLNVPVGSTLLGAVSSARRFWITACLALVAGFAIVAASPGLRVMSDPSWMRAATAMGSLALLASAFILCSRLVVSRSPALSVLVGTFLCTGVLLLVQTFSHGPIAAWLAFYWQAALAIGLAFFGAVDWHWANRQRRASLGNGYYADDRIRFLRLTPGNATRWIVVSIVSAVVSAVAMIDASANDVCCFRPGTFDQERLVAAGLTLAFCLLMLAALPAWRISLRLVRSAMLAIAFGSAVAIVMWAPALLVSMSRGGLAAAPGALDFALIAATATLAVVLLVFAPGHQTIFRWAMVASATATGLGGLATALWLSDLSSSSWIALPYPLIAALIPMATLLYDAKTAVRCVDEQANALKELSLVDEVSGIGSNRCLVSHIGRQIALADNSGVGFALAIFDIQGVKAHNRATGGHAGTSLIAFTGRVLHLAFKPTGLACRIKGDEFAVLLPPGSIPDLLTIRRKVEAAIAQEAWRIAPLSPRLYVEAFHYNPASPVAADDFLRVCQDAATRSKKSGGLVIGGSPGVAEQPTPQAGGNRLRAWARASMYGALPLRDCVRVLRAKFAARFKHDPGHIG
jgi:GGDEF domain-containing protein